MPESPKPYTCPCCGHLVWDAPPGDGDVCPICFWADDLSQLRFVMTIGLNDVSLLDAQKNVMQFGACEERSAKDVRKPKPSEGPDTNWRRFDPGRDTIEERDPDEDDDDIEYAPDGRAYYYWLQPNRWKPRDI